MKFLKRENLIAGDKTVTLYTADYKGKKFSSPSVRAALLFAFGYGSDQASELRYKLRKKIGG